MKKNIVIVGLGETGFSCVEYFTKKNMPVAVMDSRDNPPRLQELKERYPEIVVHTGGFDAEILADADLVVLSPGIAKNDPKIVQYLKKAAKITGDVELFAQELKAKPVPVVAITGSNGKSTVTTLVGAMAKQAGIKTAVGGNLGKPVLVLLEEEADLYVLELSSFQLETTDSLSPTVATILNLSPDHLDRYETVEDYYRAKERIYLNCKKIVVNRDDVQVFGHLPQGVPFISFGLNQAPVDSYGFMEHKVGDSNAVFLCRGETPLLALSELKLFGRHNVANALAALALAQAVNIPLEACLTTLKSFTGLKHRCEWIRTRNNVHWINDSKGTNVGATKAAIEGLSQDITGKWILIAGGVGKNADFSPLKSLVTAYCSAVVLIGEAGAVGGDLEKLFSDSTLCLHAKNMKEAVVLAADIAKSGDGVLLSPACASFDMFRNFEERGDAFRAEVLALNECHNTK